jgi:hypothetical protein
MAFAWGKVLKGSVYGIFYPIIRGIEGLALMMACGFFVIAWRFVREPHW